MLDSDMEILLSADENQDDVQRSIVVPIDEDMDTVKQCATMIDEAIAKYC